MLAILVLGLGVNFGFAQSTFRGTGTDAKNQKQRQDESNDSALRAVIDDSLNKSEGFASLTEKQLKEFSKYIEVKPDQPSQLDKLSPDKLISPHFQAMDLRPTDLVESFRDNQFIVRRSTTKISKRKSEDGFSGPAQFRSLIEQLIQPMADAAERRVKFKTFRVSSDENRITTSVYYHAAGFSVDSSFEQSATWEIEWTLPKGAKAPLIRGIKSTDYEESEFHGNSSTQFTDSTAQVLGEMDSFNQQLALGIGHWREAFPMAIEVDFRGHHGLAIGDVNGDGLEDLFLCQPNGMPNLLFLRQSDGSLIDISSKAGVDVLDEGKSALLLDFDNDGDQDLAVSLHDQVLIYANDGKAKFEIVKKLPGPHTPHSMSAADYDKDGDLDLFICGFWALNVYEEGNVGTAFNLPTPFHDAKNGEPNFFYRNEGGLEFTDVTKESGFDENNTRFSHAACWEDYDNDGDLDLYIANDFGRNNMYRNDNGKFVDIAAELSLEDQAAGMSVTWSDYNHDGWMDVYISNMFSAAGGRITYHRKFQTDLSNQSVKEFQRHSRGNSLFASNNAGSFEDVSETAAVVLGRWAWSSNFADFNNDSWDDLFVANGYVTNEDTGDL